VERVKDSDGFPNSVVVKQWFAHAHKDDVIDVWRLGIDHILYQAGELEYLVNDFRRGEVTLETLPAGSAERTSDGAAYLAGNTHGVATSGRVTPERHQHRFDCIAIGQFQEALGSEAIGGGYGIDDR
jgi:hypothetical protein